MTDRLRKTLLLAGLLLCAGGLVLLAYTLWPLPVSAVTETVPATLFQSPP